MNSLTPHANLVLAWLWIVLGFVVGFILGLNFHREDWLGGYASHKRRLYRLAHVSFFGLAVVNLMFCFTVRTLAVSGPIITVASWAFVVGAITMPVCCVVMAHFAHARLFFAVPVLSLILGGVATLDAAVRCAEPSSINPQTLTSNSSCLCSSHCSSSRLSSPRLSP